MWLLNSGFSIFQLTTNNITIKVYLREGHNKIPAQTYMAAITQVKRDLNTGSERL